MSGVEFRLLADSSLAFILLRDPYQNGNALDPALLQSLIEQLQLWSSNPQIRAVIVRSSSETAFSVGMDFAAFQRESGKLAEQNAAAQYCKCLDLLYRFPAPVICLLEKPAKAGGVGLLMAADLIFATREASMTLGEALFGLIPANVLPYLCKRIGERRANQMIFQPQALDADTLFTWGLIDMPPALDSAELYTCLKNFLRSTLRCSPKALQTQKNFLAQLQNLNFEEQQQLAEQTLAQCMASTEVRNGIAAFQDGNLGPWSTKLPKDFLDYLC